MKKGTLYGIGVGPGAADLLTVRAVRVLKTVDVILAAASPRNDYSRALETARPHLRAGVEVLRLEFPMTHDRQLLRQAWDVAATATERVLRQGKDAAFLTIGDPLIYSTFGYLSRTLSRRAPDLAVEVVPGITSFQAAAARTGTILCEGRESLLILPGINDARTLEHGLTQVDSAVILKAYRNFPAIRQVLEQTGYKADSLFASHVAMAGEQFTRDLDSLPDVPPYLSLVLAHRHRGG